MTDTSLGERVAYTLAGAMIGLLASVIVTLLAGLFVAFYGAVLFNWSINPLPPIGHDAIRAIAIAALIGCPVSGAIIGWRTYQ